jgi:radical SAM protein with 4Fe4S-binding SPASM domain
MTSSFGESLRALQAVEIEINHACNRSCSYCPNSILERKTKGVMSFALYELILNNLLEIDFGGRISYDFYNEPTLHPELERFVKRTKELLPKVKIHLYSNGTLLDSHKFHGLVTAGVDHFTITRHEMEFQDGKKYVFDETYKNLSDDLKKRVIYKTYQDLKLVNRGGLLKHIGAKGLALTPCHLPTHMLTVTVDGRILSCFEDYEEHLVFGDLKTQKLIDIWEKENYIQFRSDLKKGLRHLHRPCNECDRKQVLPPFN